MSGELLWRLVRLYDAARRQPGDRVWASAWFKGSPPDVSVDAGLANPEFARPKRVEREVDPSTLSTPDDPDPVNEVFANASWTPRFSAWNPTLQPPENRIKAAHLLVTELAHLVQATDLRFKVLNLWNDPKQLKIERDGRDTSDSVLDALLDLFTNGGAPSATPLYGNTDRLAADRHVQTKERAMALQVELYKDPIVDATATEYLASWVGARLFDEKQPIDPWKAGQANSAMVLERSRAADEIYKRFETRLFRGALASEIWALELAGLEVYSRLDHAIVEAARGPVLGLDARLLDALTTVAHHNLRSLDTLEPIIKESTEASILEGALARVRIETEQRAARTTINVLRNLLTEAIVAWDTKVITALEAAFASQRALLDEASDSAVPNVDSKWKERHTRRAFPAWRSTVRMPALHARVEAYRELLTSKITPISAAVDDEPEEAKASLTPPKESLIKRGKRLFEALVATRDLLLPTLGKPADRARLIAYVDALMGAHLAWIAEQPTLSQPWFTSWQGKLSVAQVRLLVDADAGGSVQEWFRAPKVVTTGGKRIQTWKEPAVEPSYWFTDQPASTLDFDMLEGVSPRDPDLEGALDTSFRNDLLRNLLADWIARRYAGGVPSKPIDRVAVQEVARAYQQYLWPVYDGALRKIWNKVTKMQSKIREAETAPNSTLKLGKLDKQLDKNLEKLAKGLFGEQP